jgi:hypothetical protein
VKYVFYSNEDGNKKFNHHQNAWTVQYIVPVNMTHSAAGNPEDPASTHPYLEGELVLLSSPYQESGIVTSESISQLSFMAAQLLQTLGLSSVITLSKKVTDFPVPSRDATIPGQGEFG